MEAKTNILHDLTTSCEKVSSSACADQMRTRASSSRTSRSLVYSTEHHDCVIPLRKPICADQSELALNAYAPQTSSQSVITCNLAIIWENISCLMSAQLRQIRLRIRAVWSVLAGRSLNSQWSKGCIEDSDQTARTRRLIWILAGRTCLKVHSVTLWSNSNSL